MKTHSSSTSAHGLALAERLGELFAGSVVSDWVDSASELELRCLKQIGKHNQKTRDYKLTESQNAPGVFPRHEATKNIATLPWKGC